MKIRDEFRTRAGAITYLKMRGWNHVRDNDQGEPVFEHLHFSTRGNQYRSVLKCGTKWLITRY